MITTEFDFELPVGYLDQDGTLHREGQMRRATAADEILPLRDPRVARNEAYLSVILLSRVIQRLGALDTITPATIEGLFAEDLRYLLNFYNKINGMSAESEVVCPHCNHRFPAGGPDHAGGSLATPSTH